MYRTPQLRPYLIRKRGPNCQECGQPPIHNGKPLCLQVDHIDGDPDHNLPANLRLLCPNCHTQTPTYKGGNIKNSKRSLYRREWRSKREIIIHEGLPPIINAA